MMGGDAMYRTWNTTTARGIDKFVQVALAQRCNGHGDWCERSAAQLAEDTGLSERTIRRSLARLEVQGEVTVEHNATRAGKYHLTLDRESPVVRDHLGQSDTSLRSESPKHLGQRVTPLPRGTKNQVLTESPTASPSVQSLVGYFVEQLAKHGATQVPASLRARLGRQAKALTAEGFTPELLRPAICALAREHKSPEALPLIVLDYQRHLKEVQA